MGPWWLYALVFLFGYMTHKTFYFLRSIRISIGLIRVSQLISLAILAKSTEYKYLSHTERLRQLKENGAAEKDSRDLRRAFNAESSNYKEAAIKAILEQHPKFYNSIVEFDNWKSAMQYLEKNKQFVLKLLKQDKK